MTIRFEVDSGFLAQEDVHLSADDIRFGFDRGYLKPSTVIEVATREVRNGRSDQVLNDLALLLSDEVDRVGDLLEQLDDPAHVHDPRESARKWLYLELKAAYESRRDLQDALGVVEELYVEFEYPASIESLIRYMPIQPGEEPGEAAILTRWAVYLESEHAALRTGS